MGHDLSLTSGTDANGKATVSTSIDTGGSLQLAAGNDLTIRQAQVSADGKLIAAAGHDLNVTSVLGDSRTVTDQTRQGKTRLVTTTTTQDIDQQALTAGNDVNLLAEQEQHDAVQDMQKKKKGFLSSKTTTTHDEWHDSTTVATTLSGDTVQIAAGHDLLSQGAQVAGTGNVVVAFGNDLTLETE
nr:hemagglutinin repeat-containing protein [Xanthomonas sacchari]